MCGVFSVSTTGASKLQVSQKVALFLTMDFGGSCGFNNIQICQAEADCETVIQKSEVY